VKAANWVDEQGRYGCPPAENLLPLPRVEGLSKAPFPALVAGVNFAKEARWLKATLEPVDPVLLQLESEGNLASARA